MVEGHRADDTWPRVDRRWRPIAAVVTVVAVTAATVLIARSTVLSEGTGTLLAWLAIAAASIIALRQWVRSAGRADRRPLGPVIVQRDGASTTTDARRHRRFVPARRGTVLHTRDGRQIPARIVDISIAGVAVEARITDLEMMAVSQVGSRPAGPVRRTANGAVFGFETLLDPQPFDASFVL